MKDRILLVSKEHEDRSQEKRRQIAKGFQKVLNQHCMENETNMPDFILAELHLTFQEAVEKAYRKDTETLDAYFTAKTNDDFVDKLEAKHLKAARSFFKEVSEDVKFEVERAFVDKEKWHIADHLRRSYF